MQKNENRDTLCGFNMAQQEVPGCMAGQVPGC